MNATPIEHRLARTSVASWVTTIITLLIQVISVPICLHYWGTNQYGIWLALLAAFTLMRTIDYGYTMYIGNEINILYHIDDNKLRKILASSIWGILALGIVQLFILISLYMFDGMGILINHTTHAYHTELFIALLIMSVSWICTASYIGIVHRLLNPLGMLYQSTWMMMWLQVAEFLVVIIAAYFKISILSTTIIYSAVLVIFYICSAIYVKSLLPMYFPWWQNGELKIGIKDIFNCLPVTFGWMMTQGGLSALVILISAFLSPTAIPAFSTLRTISNLWTTLINSFTTPMIPEAVRFYATNQWQKLTSLNNIHWLLISGLINLSILIIYPFIGMIFNLWTNYRLIFDLDLLNMLLATIVIFGMGAFMNAFLNGINSSAYIMLSSALRGGIALLLGWILLSKYGTFGLGIAIFCAEIIVFILTFFWFFNQIIDKIGGKILLMTWSWVSSLCIVLFLISQCFHLGIHNYIYSLTVTIVILSSIFSWKNLEAEIKIRILSLAKKKLFGVDDGA